MCTNTIIYLLAYEQNLIFLVYESMKVWPSLAIYKIWKHESLTINDML